ncbi:Qat anti-phage system QueC-like protein QatC [Noviherbaspirillum sp. CPCC 100848]|uniref:Qat anti-phage system QueC-like protein QatC n=1 Tax=Noviherbaspirillum album TaxID=3080276 RepID=A0ABU6JI37_9BURK|nr:Qat anti-phage system QueC-like protein QatC [Noviherbaspirillum sp. CPCC 100848]MEC4723316.1 Qat anti-phage system QueC-like protein QatC [Noviherbaspirillum sp. CPCC 100848]
MRRHFIAGRLGPTDRFAPATNDGEVVTSLELLAGNNTLGHGIGHAQSDLAGLGVYPSEIGTDLLVLAAHVHAADTRISRDTEAQDGWTREIRLCVPVSDTDRWTAASPVFVRLLNFLTGDRWRLSFRPRPARFARLSTIRRPNLLGPSFDDLSLFSGGLDSLIGGINMLEAGRTPLLISHAGEGATSDAQSTLFDTLKRTYRGNNFNRLRLWMAFPEGLVTGSGGENTTRGRSFLFFALGIFAGTGLEDGHFTLKVPENGLIAVNVPLDPLRLGALSTRTTHPFYIARWNDALAALGLNGRIENPYWDKTKGEMVRECANGVLLRQLAGASLSCSSPTKGRWQGLGTQHCGYCLPCLIRRAALVTGLSPEPDPTNYTINDLTSRVLDTRQSEGVQIRSFQLAIERLRQRPDLARILIHKPGPLIDESAVRQARLASVYQRGLEEVGILLNGVRTRPI